MGWNPLSWPSAIASTAVESYHISREMMSNHYVRPEQAASLEVNIREGHFGNKGEAVTFAGIDQYGKNKQANFAAVEKTMVVAAVATASLATGGIGGAAVAGAVGTTATVGGIAVGTLAGVAVEQGFKIADHTGVIDARADGSRSDGAIAKLVTGNGKDVTNGDIAGDVVSLGTAFLPAAAKFAGPVLQKAGGAVVQQIETIAVKTIGQGAVTASKEIVQDTVATVSRHLDTIEGAVAAPIRNSVSTVAGEKTGQAVASLAIKKAKDLVENHIGNKIENTAEKGIESALGAVIPKVSNATSIVFAEANVPAAGINNAAISQDILKMAASAGSVVQNAIKQIANVDIANIQKGQGVVTDRSVSLASNAPGGNGSTTLGRT